MSTRWDLVRGPTCLKHAARGRAARKPAARLCLALAACLLALCPCKQLMTYKHTDVVCVLKHLDKQRKAGMRNKAAVLKSHCCHTRVYLVQIGYRGMVRRRHSAPLLFIVALAHIFMYAIRAECQLAMQVLQYYSSNYKQSTTSRPQKEISACQAPKTVAQ